MDNNHALMAAHLQCAAVATVTPRIDNPTRFERAATLALRELTFQVEVKVLTLGEVQAALVYSTRRDLLDSLEDAGSECTLGLQTLLGANENRRLRDPSRVRVESALCSIKEGTPHRLVDDAGHQLVGSALVRTSRALAPGEHSLTILGSDIEKLQVPAKLGRATRTLRISLGAMSRADIKELKSRLCPAGGRTARLSISPTDRGGATLDGAELLKWLRNELG